MVAAIRVETIQSFLDTMYENNIKFDLRNFEMWKNGKANSTCDDVQGWMPNMKYDLECMNGHHYGIDYDFSLASKP